ncbi:hypothetical protein DFH07DRAFT_781706 [Mycena maculata]|uniref:Uncharacterized protein n=1 Tax=Mycena maculata TaxID=230809 RepID=A0AAD7HX83_9AGAR|nr:hypothetical protein DFH07DRAFT_781706 [Mycena maculata]
MPKPTKSQEYSDVLFITENLLAASVALEEDVDNLDGFEEDEAEILCDNISEILDLESFNWLKIAESMRKVAAGMGSKFSHDPHSYSLDFETIERLSHGSTSLGKDLTAS